MKLKHLELKLKINDVTDSGTFNGVASPYGNIDLGGEVVEKGAFTKSLKEQSEVPLLWQHDRKEPIGVGVLEDGAKGLAIDGELILEVAKAKEAYALMKPSPRLGKVAIKGLSIGYEIVKDSIENGVRRLKELRLWEVSLVTFPMNQMAQVTAVKGMNLDLKMNFTTALDIEETWSKRYQMMYALQGSLDSIAYDANLTNDEKAAAIDASIGQFRDAYTEFIPKFLDLMAERYKSADGLGRLEQKASTDEAHTILRALLPSAEAATKSLEPVIDHSTLQQFKTDIKELLA